MRGAELDHAYNLERARLRRAAQDKLRGDKALDWEMLGDLLQAGPGSSRCNVLTRILVTKALLGDGCPPAIVADATNTPLAELEAVDRHQLMADPSIAERIQVELRARFVETPEPGRYVEPSRELPAHDRRWNRMRELLGG